MKYLLCRPLNNARVLYYAGKVSKEFMTIVYIFYGVSAAHFVVNNFFKKN